MKKSVLKRVKAGSFCTIVRSAIELLPDFLGEEKALIKSELDVLEGQINAVRGNCHLRTLVDKYLPEVWRTVRMLKLDLRSAEEDDETAKNLLVALGIYVPKRTNVDEVIFWLEQVCAEAVPERDTAGMIFLHLQTLLREMKEINELRIAERNRIMGIGRGAETRERIVSLLIAAEEIAKGMTHRTSTKSAAEDAIDTLETLSHTLEWHMPRRKRGRKKKEDEKKEITTSQEPKEEVVQEGLGAQNEDAGKECAIKKAPRS